MPLFDAIRLHAFVPKIAIMTMIFDHGPRELEKRSVDTSSAVIQYQQGSAGISTASRGHDFRGTRLPQVRRGDFPNRFATNSNEARQLKSIFR
jgi:hypothetical protein